MAKSPTHKFGQIIGDMVERSMQDPLQDFVNTHDNLYLDTKGYRRARRGKKVSWTDKYGNAHDLDFVIERDGTPNQIGKPVAFIETAWRRYTKHSRNKAQEIQGAIVPLVETYSDDSPFIGVVLAGVFTDGSINQLKSLGFEVLYFDYEDIKDSFSHVGIDASFDEDTPDDEVKKKVEIYESLSSDEVLEVGKHLRIRKDIEITSFIEKVEKTVSRKIESIIVIALHGVERRLSNIEDAIDYIRNYETDYSLVSSLEFRIFIRYSNGDKVDGDFKDKENAVTFLSYFI